MGKNRKTLGLILRRNAEPIPQHYKILINRQDIVIIQILFFLNRSMRVLYHYPLCPFSRKVRLVLNEKRLDHTSEIEQFWLMRPAFLRMNAAATVPVLIDLGGIVLSDDQALCEYLEHQYEKPSLLGDNILQQTETRRLIGWFDKKFYKEVSESIYIEKILKRFIKDQGGPNSNALRSARHHIHFHLEYISWLVDRRNWLAGDIFTLADIAAASHLSVVDYCGDVPFDKYPIAKEWYVRIKSRPSFRSLLYDKVPGIQPASHYSNLDF